MRLCFKPFFHWRRRMAFMDDWFAVSFFVTNLVWFSIRIYGYGVTVGFKWRRADGHTER